MVSWSWPGSTRVTPDLASGPYLYFDLTFIDWDHSLLAALVLSAVWGILFARNRATGVMAAIAAFSHFVTDWPVHNHDLALYPYSHVHMGLSLWRTLGVGAWVAEPLFCAVLLSFAWFREARRGVSLLWPIVVVVLAFVQLSPWTSPMRWVATLPEPQTHLLHGFGVAFGFILPAFLIMLLYGRAERRALGATAAD